MLTTTNWALAGVQNSTQEQESSSQNFLNSFQPEIPDLEFNQENFIMIIMENLKLHKELNEALETILVLQKESNKDFLKHSDISLRLKIA